ncbi:protein FAM177A1 isoform X1 [Centruroides vittatus]|uniref:protein FAM177A1 isoform X1 n=1 Tax=Centruroides vittatus TaxID=120091 RepID=UPI00350E8DEA
MTNDYIEASPEEVKLQATEFDSEISSMTRSNNFTEVSLGEKRRKIPKRILHFSDGQLEEYSSDDDDEFDSIKDQKPLINPKTLPWFPYLWYLTWWLGSRTLAVCDYLGEHLAYFFGITSPKYYYELQEYKRMIEEEDQEQKENLEESAGWKSSSNIELKTVHIQEPTKNMTAISGTPFTANQVISPSDSQHWERSL